MNARTLPLPPDLRTPEVSHLDLDARIRRVEQRLVARDAVVRERSATFALRLRRAFTPMRLAASALGALLGVTGLWWMLRGRKPWLAADGARPDPRDAEPEPHHGGLPWLPLLSLGWPLLPASLRERTSPATLRLLVALGLPLAQRLRRGRPTPPLATMAPVDPSLFGGSWHVVAHLPTLRGALATGQGGSRVHYRPLGRGGFAVAVRSDHGGGQRLRVGLARPVVGSGGGKLQLSLWPGWLRWLSMAWSEHWILHLDADGTEALVGNPQRDELWVLSRRRHLAPARLDALLAMARDDGFAIGDLRFSPGTPSG